ncbi:MAG: 3'-5' exonuclease [Deltaproteobacteria bacterium]|nr:3'-5' exonuclease [Deltaproteobacteria bacterium]
MLGPNQPVPSKPIDPTAGVKAAPDARKRPLSEASFVVVDLETTGLNPGPGRIIEIGAQRVEQFTPGTAFQTLVRPSAPVSPFITSLTSITNRMVKTAPRPQRALAAFRSFVGDAVLVAHHARFDLGFLEAELGRLFHLPLSNPVVCTVAMARALLPEPRPRRYSLDHLARHLSLPVEQRHRALPDAQLTALLLIQLLQLAVRRGVGYVDELPGLLSSESRPGASVDGRRRPRRHGERSPTRRR